MMIGCFRSVGGGFAGHLRTLTIDAEVAIVPAQSSDAENAPAWRVLLGSADDGVEIGAGWDRTGERAGPFIAVQIEDPLLEMPLRANLLRSARDDGDHHLLWTRPAAPKRS